MNYTNVIKPARYKKFWNIFIESAKIESYIMFLSIVCLILSMVIAPINENITRILLMLSLLLLASAALYITAGLIFEGIVRYSQYGLSQNHPILNHVVSISAIICPILLPFGTIYCLVLMIYSKKRSPNILHNVELLQRSITADKINLVFIIVIYLLLFTSLLLVTVTNQNLDHEMNLLLME